MEGGQLSQVIGTAEKYRSVYHQHYSDMTQPESG